MIIIIILKIKNKINDGVNQNRFMLNKVDIL